MIPFKSSPASQTGDGDLTGSSAGLALPATASDSDAGRGVSDSSPGPTPSTLTPIATQLPASNAQGAREREPKGPLRPTASNHSTVGLDPLSTQIYLRTNSNTESPPTIAQRLRNTGRPDTPTNDGNNGPTPDSAGKPPNPVVDATKEWRKTGSFLSRLNMRSPWARDDDALDSDSELGELRDSGTHARAFTSVAGAGGGYIPMYKGPPRYISVKTRNKRTKEFNRMFLAQELSVCNSDDEEEPTGRAPATAIGRKILKGASAAIWAAEFSLDGKYLAIGGKDNMVRIYAVISTPEERKAHEDDEMQNQTSGEKLSAPVFRDKPVQEFGGHTGEVLALSWSKNGFLLSSSMDKTVKLWHPQRPECLASFLHHDLVTSIAFHPTDDRFFLAGSLDAKLRLWSITEKSVPFLAETNEFITAVGFSPDGKMAICGSLSGMCTFYDTQGLKVRFQIHVRSSRGKNARGSKITGIRTVAVPDGPDREDVRVLISSNDSRVRIYSLVTRMLVAKFRGHVNQSSQIHARFSEDGKYVICGSEDRKAYIWSPTTTNVETRDKQPYEYFDAHPEVVTVVSMAPTKSKQLLSASGDPVYDLCNPPPVMLMSLNESLSNASDGGQSERQRQASQAKKPEESPAYLERAKHHDGHIIITTDRTGTIKVFRQDCAFVKRQQHMWETGSKLSGKIAGGVGRSPSIRTKTSGTSRVHSRRGSLSIGQSPLLPQPPSDRIISWRQDVGGGLRPSRNATPTRSERSLSPTKAGLGSVTTSALNVASESRKEPQASRRSATSPPGTPDVPSSPTSSTHTNQTTVRLARERTQDSGPSAPPMPSFSFLSAADAKGGRDERGFWNLSRWRGGLSGRSQTSDSSGHKSTSANEPGKLNANDEGTGDRRPSSGARLPSDPKRASPSQQEVSNARRASSRVDSGVGRLSGDSSKSDAE